MKPLLLALLVPALALAQLPVKPSASVTAKTMAARSGRVNSFVTDYGSYDTSYERQVRVEAQVSTSGRVSFPAVLHWFIVVKPLKSSKRITVETGEIPVKVAPGGSTKVDFTSKPVSASDMNLKAIGVRDLTGAKIDGWAIRITTQDGAELASTTNTPAALEWLKTQPEWVTGKVKDED